jgi:hypothetical protein
LYHRVIIADNRGLPIKYNTLKPYSSEEIHQFINTKYQDWYRAGGYFYHKFYRSYPTFWIDLWEIVAQEYPILLEWYLPEVEEVDTQVSGEEEEIQATRDQMTPTRRRRSLSPTQFRFLYPATPLAVPGTRATQQQN